MVELVKDLTLGNLKKQIRSFEYLACFVFSPGADVRSKTPLGRTALHVAVTSGQLDCIDILLTYGAKNTDEDNEGHNAVILARLWGQKESERRIFRYQWRMRASSGRSSMKPSPEEKVEAGL